MSEDWAAVQADIAGAIASVGFAATLEEPPSQRGPDYNPTLGWAQTYPVTVIDEIKQRADASGTGVMVIKRVLTIAAGGVVPEKGWRIQVREQWYRIGQVLPLAPGGVSLLYKIEVQV